MRTLLLIPAPVWLLLSAVFFACGEFTSKHWSYSPSIGLAAVTVGLYAVGSLLWLPALLHNNSLAVTGMAWALLGTVVTVAMGLLVFHEKVSLVKGVGIAFSFVSLMLLSL